MTYQIYKYNQLWGPYDAAMVRGMVQSQQVSVGDLVCGEGQANWMTIQNVFFDTPQSVVRTPKQHGENKKVQAVSCPPKRASLRVWTTMGALAGLAALVCFLIFRQPSIPQDERIIREAVGELLNKPSSELVQEDFDRVISLKLPSSGLIDISLIGRMPNLEELALPNNRIDDLSPLRELKSLKYLDLAGNKISDLSPIKDLSHLEELNLGGNSLKELDPLAGLKNITALDLGFNQAGDFKLLAGLPKLEVINLTGNRIKSLEPLLLLDRLEVVVVGANSGISQTDRTFAHNRLPGCQFIW
jgi:Leucine-rich repeat (LRR) protein